MEVLLHLGLSHFVIALPIFALALLIVAAIKQRASLYRIGAALLILAAVLVIPQYLIGEAAEEIVEHDETAHQYMEEHEELATITLWLFIGTGVIALAALWRGRSEEHMRPWLFLLLLLSLASATTVAITAHHGGQIRHPALREGAATVQPTGSHEHGAGENHNHQEELEEEHEHNHDHD